jgi:hypothetical protein
LEPGDSGREGRLLGDDIAENPWGAPPDGLDRMMQRDAVPEDELTLCHDCGIDAWQFEEEGRLVHEDFGVVNEVWDTACPDDQVVRWTAPTGEQLGQGLFVVCVGCLERRLGRRLTREDLVAAPGDDALGLPPSMRLVDRWESG